MKVVTKAQMQDLDRRAIEDLGIPGPVLMENAAIGVVDALADHFPQATVVTLVCGPGNNGGDGLAMARHLDGRGYDCQVFLALGRSRPQGDAGLQLAIVERAGLLVETINADDDLQSVAEACRDADVVVDALFGIGLGRPLSGHFAALATLMGACGTPCLAVDLPSGLDGDQGTPIGPHATAELTVTFALPKLAHVLPPACDAVGVLAVADLGLPARILEETSTTLDVLDRATLAPVMPTPDAGGHKGDFGHAVLVGGAPGKAGAVVLGARAAVRSGAGLVTAAVPTPLLALVDAGSWASMTLPLEADGDGLLVDATPALALADGVRRGAVAVGPGLGTAPATVAAVRALVAGLDAPLVLDADGLNAFAGDLEGLASARAGRPTVLTPHAGEMGRLLGMSIASVEADRLAAARRAADESGAVVVLKGRRSVIATPGGGLAVNPTGNVGMATGGSGDVLTGVVVALLAQGIDAESAARIATFVHGLTGDDAASRLGPRSLGAEDLIESLPEAFLRLSTVDSAHD